MFCSSLPDSYKPTAWQYLDNITIIANYELLDIIARVLQEESRRKAQALGQGSSLNKFSTVKNIGQKCAKCGKTNHTTQNHWPGRKHPQKGKGNKSQKALGSSGKKKADKRGKGKEKAQTSANVLDIADISELSITSSKSINFPCYEMSETVEWFLDSGCTDHITPRKSDFVQYRELGQPHKAEIVDGKYLRIEGFGTVIGHSKMPHSQESLQIRNILYVPDANKQLFSLIAAGQRGSMSQTTNVSTTVSQNGTPYIIGTPKSGKLNSFDMVLAKNQSEIPRAIIVTLSDYTLWHRRMGHAHQRVIKHLVKNTEGGPHQTTEAPHEACEGCEKRKSKRLPFPSLKSRALKPLDLVHSDLDKMPVLSIGGYKYTTTYLDDHSSFGVMFYLKNKNKEFNAFKTYKAWAERQLGTKLKCKRTDCGGEFMSEEQKAYLTENGIEHQTSMPDSPQQNGQVERFQRTIINGAEAMWHHAGLSNHFWIYTVKAKHHTYNVTPIKCADYKTLKELWSGHKPNISHL